MFIRPIQAEDGHEIANFLRQHGRGSAEGLSGILGKLVGDLVAVLLVETTGQTLAIRELIVRADLRHKRIGRQMLDELDRTASQKGLDTLESQSPEDARLFFQKMGFVEEGHRMVRRVRRAE